MGNGVLAFETLTAWRARNILGTRPARRARRQTGVRKGAGAGRQADDIMRPRERPGDSMSVTAPRETPKLGIFWVVQTSKGEATLLTAGCPLDRAEPYGDCLTYGPGHYETWAQWRRDRTINPALRALVRSYEYEDWPRGRIVFDQSRALFIIYADRKLLTPARIARIATQFHLPAARTGVQSDWHYQSTETPDTLET
jgi:hypothetical protein